MQSRERSCGSGRAPGAAGGRLRLALALALFAGALLACGQGSAITLTNAPASELKLDIWIRPDGEQVKISVSITNAAGNPVNLRHGQQITCNGVAFPPGQNGGSSSGTLPDERVLEFATAPPGAVYTFIYTDERGRQTTLVVPNFPVQMLTPRAGDIVPIPQPLSQTGGTLAATPTPGQHVPERATDQTASLAVLYALPPLPSQAVAYISAYARWPSFVCPPDQSQCDNNAPCAPSKVCGYIRVDAPPIEQADVTGTTQTVTIADYAYPPSDGFEAFQPGPGRIGLSSDIQWDVLDAGFADAHIAVDSDADTQITWARG